MQLVATFQDGYNSFFQILVDTTQKRQALGQIEARHVEIFLMEEKVMVGLRMEGSKGMLKPVCLSRSLLHTHTHTHT